MAKQLTRSLADVLNDVRAELLADYGITPQMLAAMKQRVDANGHDLPTGSMLMAITDLWFDYTVQRNAIIKHILKIAKGYDPRLHGPASACRVKKDPKVLVYDGQQRSLARAVLGFDTVPVIVVDTDDVAFASYAFEALNETGVEKLLPADLHRNALTRYALNCRDERSVQAYAMQKQFDDLKIDLEDKATRKSAKLRGPHDYFFSHFAYAIKVIKHDPRGEVLHSILEAIKAAFPKDEEINQDLFIGLYELNRLDTLQLLPAGWMQDVLKTVAKTFPQSTGIDGKSLFKQKAKMQVDHITPGRGWDAPNIMSNFLREVYMLAGGKISLPFHGPGAQMQIATNPAPGLMPAKKVAGATVVAEAA